MENQMCCEAMDGDREAWQVARHVAMGCRLPRGGGQVGRGDMEPGWKTPQLQ